MNINRNEYKALKKYYKSRPHAERSEISDKLIRRKLIERYEVIDCVKGVNKYSDKCRITTEGQISYEQYREKHREMRNTKITSWIALAISLASFMLSVLNYFKLP